MEFDKTSCAALGFFQHKPSPMIPPLQETFTSAIFVNFFFFIKKNLMSTPPTRSSTEENQSKLTNERNEITGSHRSIRASSPFY